jgi:plastocyanin
MSLPRAFAKVSYSQFVKSEGVAMRRFVIAVSLASVGAALAVSLAGAATPKHATVLIRHQTAHCHAWSFDNGKFGAAVTGTVAAGATITFTNNDVMSHKLIEKSGPAAAFKGSPLLNKMGASVTVSFPKAGVYVFGTKPGEDYMKGVTTTGADNVLTLKITVK